LDGKLIRQDYLITYGMNTSNSGSPSLLSKCSCWSNC